MTKTYDIFLSHNGSDKAWTEKLVFDIENEVSGTPLKVFFDKWDIKIGADIPYELEQGLKNSRFIGLVMTPEAFFFRLDRFGEFNSNHERSRSQAQYHTTFT